MERGTEIRGRITRPPELGGDLLAFRLENGEEAQVVAPYVNFGDVSRRRMRQAALLETPVRMRVTEDPERAGRPLPDRHGRMTALWFEPDTKETIAQQVDRLGTANTDALLELVSLSVYDGRFREYSMHSVDLIDGREIIQWRDESVTVVEHREGTPRGRRLLPPLPNLAALTEPGSGEEGDDPEERWSQLRRNRENLIDLGMIHRAQAGLLDRLPSNYRVTGMNRPDAAPLLSPAGALAGSFREAMADREERLREGEKRRKRENRA